MVLSTAAPVTNTVVPAGWTTGGLASRRGPARDDPGVRTAWPAAARCGCCRDGLVDDADQGGHPDSDRAHGQHRPPPSGRSGRRGHQRGAGGGDVTRRTTGRTATANAWVLSVWSDKQSAQHTWTTSRWDRSARDVSAPGTGAVATMLADSNGPVAAGTVARADRDRADVQQPGDGVHDRAHRRRDPGTDNSGPRPSSAGARCPVGRSSGSGVAQGRKCVRSRAMSPKASHSALVDSDQRQSPLAPPSADG